MYINKKEGWRKTRRIVTVQTLDHKNIFEWVCVCRRIPCGLATPGEVKSPCTIRPSFHGGLSFSIPAGERKKKKENSSIKQSKRLVTGNRFRLVSSPTLNATPFIFLLCRISSHLSHLRNQNGVPRQPFLLPPILWFLFFAYCTRSSITWIPNLILPLTIFCESI